MLELTVAYLIAAAASAGLFLAARKNRQQGWYKARVPMWLTLAELPLAPAAPQPSEPVAQQLQRLNLALSAYGSGPAPAVEEPEHTPVGYNPIQ